MTTTVKHLAQAIMRDDRFIKLSDNFVVGVKRLKEPSDEQWPFYETTIIEARYILPLTRNIMVPVWAYELFVEANTRRVFNKLRDDYRLCDNILVHK